MHLELEQKKNKKRCLRKKQKHRKSSTANNAKLMASFINNCGLTYFSDVPMPLFTN